MKKILTEDEKNTIYEEVKEILSDELGKPVNEINPKTRIIEDLEGDSLIYLELIEEFKRKYGFGIEVRVIGQYLIEHPVYTVEETAHAIYDIMERGDELMKGAVLKGA